MTRPTPSHLFQCEDEDFEGDFEGAVHHCDITGHTLKRTNSRGNVITIGRDSEDDE